jgi:DNA-binding transcriptional LysR family regulator
MIAMAPKAISDLSAAISRAVADAEHTLGVPLFERSKQGAEPTQYGRALLKRGVAPLMRSSRG